MSERAPFLHICTTCRAGQALAEGDTPPGQHLLEAAAALADARVEVRPVSCLANCERGCSAVISAPGKWSYLLGGLSNAVAADLLIYAAAYAASKTGAVMPSKRPASLAGIVFGRVPPHETL